MSVTIIDELLGKNITGFATSHNSVIKKVGKAEDFTDRTELAIYHDEGVMVFDHIQRCCECVCIVDVEGDLNDLLGSPVIEAEEVTEFMENGYDKWTFYKISTAKGGIVVRWSGTSSGYYSVDVDYTDDKKQEGVRKYLRSRKKFELAGNITGEGSPYAPCPKTPGLWLKHDYRDLLKGDFEIVMHPTQYWVDRLAQEVNCYQGEDKSDVLTNINMVLMDRGFALNEHGDWLYYKKQPKRTIGYEPNEKYRMVPKDKHLLIQSGAAYHHGIDVIYTVGLTKLGMSELIGETKNTEWVCAAYHYIKEHGLPEDGNVYNELGQRARLVLLTWEQILVKRHYYPQISRNYGFGYNLTLVVPQDSVGKLIGEDQYGSDGVRDDGLIIFFGGIPTKVN